MNTAVASISSLFGKHKKSIGLPSFLRPITLNVCRYATHVQCALNTPLTCFLWKLLNTVLCIEYCMNLCEVKRLPTKEGTLDRNSHYEITDILRSITTHTNVVYLPSCCMKREFALIAASISLVGEAWQTGAAAAENWNLRVKISLFWTSRNGYFTTSSNQRVP